MIRTKLAFMVLAAILAVSSALQARAGNTLQDEFRIYAAEIATQCTSVKEQLASFVVDADPLTGYTLKDAVQSLCVCIPAKLEALKSTVAAPDLAHEISEEEVLKLFNPAVIDKCAAEQMHSMYGQDCPKRFKLADLDVPHYCSCMQEVITGYSDADTAALAAIAQDYLPIAAEAEKAGQPIPPRPPLLESYFRADEKCKGARKAFEGLKP